MSNLATEDMDRLTEIASFRNAESTGAINRDFAKRIIATHNGLAILHERHDEICREWESACERERAANHLLAEKTAECDTIRRDAQAATAREAVERALQAAWNDVCTDSGCHPDCFTRKGKRLVANFARGGTFTQLVAEYLNVSAGGAGSGPEEHGETVQSKCSCRERAVAVMDVERAWMNPPDDVNKNEYVYSAPDVRKLFDEILDAIDKGSQGRFPNLRAAFPISDEKERSEAMIALEGDSHVSAGGSARLIDEDRHGAPAHYNHDEVCAWIRGYNQAAAELLAASQGEAERHRSSYEPEKWILDLRQFAEDARARKTLNGDGTHYGIVRMSPDDVLALCDLADAESPDTRRLDQVAELASRVVQLGEGMPFIWKVGSTLLGGKTFRAALDEFAGEQSQETR